MNRTTTLGIAGPTRFATMTIASRLARLPVVLLLGAAVASCQNKGASADATAGPLAVDVVSARSGEPVEGVRVSLLRQGSGELDVRVTGDDGRATWAAGSAASTQIVVTDPRRRFADQSIEVEGRQELRIELREGAIITIAVAGSDGAVVQPEFRVWTADRPSGVRIEAASPSLAGSPEACAQEVYHLGPFAPGPAKLFVSSTGCVTRVIDVHLSGEPVDLGLIELERGGTQLTGRTDPSLGAVPDEVYLRFAGAGLSAPVVGGSFELRGLPETEGVIVFRLEGRELFRRSIFVSGDRVDLGVVSPSS